MQKFFILSLFLFVFAVSSVMAWPIVVESQDGPQDPLFIEGDVHELGDLFPPEELIESTWAYTEERSCFEEGTDDPTISNIMVTMTNLTTTFWYDVHYVADPETTITNFDGWIGNAGLADAEEAFLIDYAGINRPLYSESMTPDAVFEPGEIWEFIIQDYGNALGGPPTPFDSLGIASLSTGWPPSTGSIIAVPEPATLLLLSLGSLALRRRRT